MDYVAGFQISTKGYFDDDFETSHRLNTRVKIEDVILPENKNYLLTVYQEYYIQLIW